MQTRPMARLSAAIIAIGALALAGCASDDLAKDNPDAGSGDKGSVTIASQDFPEAAVVTALYDQLLTDQGYDVTTKLVGTRAVYMKEFPTAIDIVPEYVAGISDYLNTTANGPEAEPLTTNDAAESVEKTKPLLDKAGITLLQPSEAFSANAFFVTQERADQTGTKLSDYEGQKIVLAAAPDCKGRDDCELGLKNVYGINLTKILPLGYASPQTYQSVIDGESQFGLTGSTDGTLADQGLVLLEDDKGIQPAQNLVPAVSTVFLKEHPDVSEVLDELMNTLDNDNLGQLVVKVSVDREKPEDVAKQFLTDQGLV